MKKKAKVTKPILPNLEAHRPIANGRQPLRESGRALGAGYARITGASRQRIENMAGAISTGFENAALRDAETAELSNDDEWLSSMGF